MTSLTKNPYGLPNRQPGEELHLIKDDRSDPEGTQPTDKDGRILREMRTVILGKPDHTFNILH
jgi:hypothetical protein